MASVIEVMNDVTYTLEGMDQTIPLSAISQRACESFAPRRFDEDSVTITVSFRPGLLIVRMSGE